LPFDEGSASAPSTTSLGTPTLSLCRSISFHAIFASPGTCGSARNVDSCSVIATTAQMFSGVGAICSVAKAV